MDATALDVASNNRRDARTNLFALATLCVGSIRRSVRIRNLSPTGALIDGDDLPGEGEMIGLVRNEQSAKAVIRWREHQRAGIQFSSDICVDDWLPHRNGAQKQATRVIAALEQNGRTSAVGPDAVEPPDPERLARALDALADALADDMVVIARHSHSLQTLDIVAQGLRRLAKEQG